MIVPMLRVGMYPVTLCVTKRRTQRRPRLHSHAERGNDQYERRVPSGALFLWAPDGLSSGSPAPSSEPGVEQGIPHDHQQAAECRHHYFHADVSAGRANRRDQPVAGFS
ncbi:hypothetical protein EJA71_27185 [Pseudomonas sp. PB106]|nr:hypothetical protein EJA71_27185 [Pseudomonas sp. PB106]